MYTELHSLLFIQPEELDDYLDRGWFRMGQMIFTCHILCFNDDVYSTIWMRLDLENFTFKRSMRKILNRNDRLFRVEIGDPIFGGDRQALYQKHKSRFEGYIPGTLRESLFGLEEDNIYNTREIAVYDGDRLIAISYFDLGANSMASIMGLFDPDYEKYSLGLYTMVKEVEFGIDHHLKFYYPGYVVPGYKKFDYKLRLGGMDFFDVPSKIWKPYDQLSDHNLPSKVIYSMLDVLSIAFKQNNLTFRRLTYPFFDKEFYGNNTEALLQAPLILDCRIVNDDNAFYFVEYNLKSQKYHLYKGRRLFNMIPVLISSFLERFDPERSCLDMVQIDNLLVMSKDPKDIINEVLTILR
jgi:leucyl-tRNA---protein transferase